MAECRIAQVAVSGVPYAVDKPYSYLIPEELAAELCVGTRVMVPFGRANKPTEAMVLSLRQGERTAQLKRITAALDNAPLLDDAALSLAQWMKARYFCTLYDAFRTILPSGIWYEFSRICSLTEKADCARMDDAQFTEIVAALRASGGSMDCRALLSSCKALTEARLRQFEEEGLLRIETTARRSVGDKTIRLVSLAMTGEDAMAMVEPKRKSAPVRYEVVRLLCAEGTLSSAELSYYTGAAMTTLRALERAGIVTICEQEKLRIKKHKAAAAAVPVVLNDEQTAALDAISQHLAQEQPSVMLLQGVTASGKTQVYLRAIEKALALGKSALMLVPEIALTPQMLEKFTAHFGDQVAMLHSSLRLTERYDQWKRIRRGDVRVVLGTRSAVFAPLQNIGLIVMDEEQETTYQSENAPRYHTRDVAKYRCAQDRALLLLGSATPSVESAYHAENGRYERVYLRRRYNETDLPRVLIADLREELRAGNDGCISAVLKEELSQNIARGEQSILFLNRRGNSRMLVCGECGAVPECPRCSVAMTYHSANGRMMCHYCGHSEPMRETCPACGGIMKRVGIGTQKAEDELRAIFPDTPILRMDTDTVGLAQGHEAILSKFERENVPILLGTQMVAKGLDFENVTLVGALSADHALYVENYHAAERTFSLLAQVVGRAGRGGKKGRAVIQTFTPENDVIRAAAAQDYEAFYEGEIRMRRVRRYPPFADIFTLTVTGADEGRVLRAATHLRDGLRAIVGQLPQLRQNDTDILGPSAAPVARVNNQYRYRVFLVGQNDAITRRVVAHIITTFYAQKENRGLSMFADCNSLD
ncbi:MAG: primosomal protein N' [Oscillospiraceae bacterium]|nr:primosomal protein N' [Oscillospiraceae bacterium]